jgi:hypothetical protein
MLESTASFLDIQGVPVREGHSAIPTKKETDVLKKTCAIGGLLLSTTAGALLTSSPVSAQVPTWGGGCCGSHSSFRHFSRHHNRNWNGNENSNLNHIRLHLNNRNNNIAVARTGRDRGDDGLGIGGLGLGLGGDDD